VVRQIFIGAIILGVAALAAILLISSREEPPKKEKQELVPLVQIAPVEIRAGGLAVAGSGTVRAREELNLAAEIPGKLVYVNPSLREGERVQKGAVLFRIEPADYRSAVDGARADVASQQVAVMEAKEEMRLAKEELDRFAQRQSGQDRPFANVDKNDFASRILPPAELEQRSASERDKDEGNKIVVGSKPQRRNAGILATREPQLLAAQAALRRAQAQLNDANIALKRTVVRAPFSGVVRSENISVGSYVSPGQSLGSLVGTRSVEVVIPLSEKDAALIPGIWQPPRGRPIQASVYLDFGGTRYRWQAYVDRANNVLNPQTRTIDVFLRVPNPTRGGSLAAEQLIDAGSASETAGRTVPAGTGGPTAPPLLVGSFVDAQIEGQNLERYALIPIAALRPGNKVWLVKDGRLRITDVDVLQRSDRFISVRADDLSANVPVIVSSLQSATEGQRLRLPSQDSGKKKSSSDPKAPAKAKAGQQPARQDKSL